eukprot:6993393-Prymnesium_polylepis.1
MQIKQISKIAGGQHCPWRLVNSGSVAHVRLERAVCVESVRREGGTPSGVCCLDGLAESERFEQDDGKVVETLPAESGGSGGAGAAGGAGGTGGAGGAVGGSGGIGGADGGLRGDGEDGRDGGDGGNAGGDGGNGGKEVVSS